VYVRAFIFFNIYKYLKQYQVFIVKCKIIKRVVILIDTWRVCNTNHKIKYNFKVNSINSNYTLNYLFYPNVLPTWHTFFFTYTNLREIIGVSARHSSIITVSVGLAERVREKWMIELKSMLNRKRYSHCMHYNPFDFIINTHKK